MIALRRLSATCTLVSSANASGCTRAPAAPRLAPLRSPGRPPCSAPLQGEVQAFSKEAYSFSAAFHIDQEIFFVTSFHVRQHEWLHFWDANGWSQPMLQNNIRNTTAHSTVHHWPSRTAGPCLTGSDRMPTTPLSSAPSSPGAASGAASRARLRRRARSGSTALLSAGSRPSAASPCAHQCVNICLCVSVEPACQNSSRRCISWPVP